MYFSHLNGAVEGIISPANCEFLKGIFETVATDVVDCVHVKKCALNIWVVKIIKETVASSMMTIPTNTVMSPHACSHKLISLLTIIEDKHKAHLYRASLLAKTKLKSFSTLSFANHRPYSQKMYSDESNNKSD